MSLKCIGVCDATSYVTPTMSSLITKCKHGIKSIWSTPSPTPIEDYVYEENFWNLCSAEHNMLAIDEVRMWGGRPRIQKSTYFCKMFFEFKKI
jgi:hypothetical protein